MKEKQLHDKAKELEDGFEAINELLDVIYSIVGDLSKEEGLIKLKQITEKLKQEK